jgi:hypothetical protein
MLLFQNESQKKLALILEEYRVIAASDFVVTLISDKFTAL